MLRFFDKRPKYKESVASSSQQSCQQPISNNESEVDLEALESDPGLRKKISDFHPNLQDEVRRAYLQKGPCQPCTHQFPVKHMGGKSRRFVPSWFTEYDWLEYSITKDVAFCFPCYLFKGESEVGHDHFVSKGFVHWNKKKRFDVHVGSSNSPHYKATKKCRDLMNQKQSIQASLEKQSDQVKSDYRIRLGASVETVRFLLRRGFAFRGNNESEDSMDRCNFFDFLGVLARNNPSIARVVLENAPKNNQMTSPEIQKDITYACASLTVNELMKEIGDDVFAVLVDEAGDIANKEQMAVVLRYVDDRGFLMERFVGIAHVKDTTALSLKVSLESMLTQYGLCLSKVRGQGYDGASNMRGRFGGLKTLIQNENPCAYYVHCFAHQLQLALVGVVKRHIEVNWLLGCVNRIVTEIGSSNKRQDCLRDKQAAYLENALEEGLLETGRGLNQESILARAGDTRWGSHLRTFLSVKNLYSPVLEVLEDLEADSANEKSSDARNLVEALQSFDLVFMLHLMTNILAITGDLSQSLQKRDQEISNAVILVKTAKRRLQNMRDDGWEALLIEVMLFCNMRDINVPDMNEQHVFGKKSHRKAPKVTNLHHFKCHCFYSILDMILKELNCRFDEASTELLRCVSCLNPSSLFDAFDKKSLIRMAEFYPSEFSHVDVLILDNQLENYIMDVRSDDKFRELKGLVDLSRLLVQTRKHKAYPFVYMLVKLALLLPVATASVERVFSAMNFVKTKLRNRMCDQWLGDCLVTYIERDVFSTISDDAIIECFQNMKSRRQQL